MKKGLALVLSLILVISLFAGCAKVDGNTPSGSGEAGNNGEKKVKVACMLNGLLGDKGLLDSAADGVRRAEKDFDNLEVKVIEAGYDASKWEATLEDLSSQDYDIIITGLFSMREYVEKTAPKYPEVKYIVFDTTPDYEKYDLKNVHSITYKQNEGAFLAGALAALISESDLPLVNKNSNTISVVGGVDSPVINDFVVGYIQGAKYVNPEITVLNAYIASVSDAPKCKDVSLQMYAQNSNVNFSPSGGAVMGSMDAAKEAGRYVIGVDADQCQQFLETDPEMANLVISSAIKNVGQSLYLALGRYLKNEIPWGSGEVMGLEDGTVGLAKNEIYEKVVPQDIKDRLDEIEKKISNGEIVVRSSFSMTQEELDEIRAN